MANMRTFREIGDFVDLVYGYKEAYSFSVQYRGLKKDKESHVM